MGYLIGGIVGLMMGVALTALITVVVMRRCACRR